MHRLIILTANPTEANTDSTFVVTCDGGPSTRYHMVGRIGDLLYYRSASMTDEEARTIAGFDLPDVPVRSRRRS